MSELPVFATYPKSKFRGLLLNKKKAFERDASNFNLKEVVDLDQAGQRLDSVGIKRHHLEDADTLQHYLSEHPCVLTKGIAIDLELYRRNFSKTFKHLSSWMVLITPDCQVFI